MYCRAEGISDWSCLALEKLILHLPREGVLPLRALCDELLSDYETLNQANVSCLNTAVYSLLPQHMVEFIDLIAARLVSLNASVGMFS